MVKFLNKNYDPRLLYKKLEIDIFFKQNKYFIKKNFFIIDLHGFRKKQLNYFINKFKEDNYFKHFYIKIIHGHNNGTYIKDKIRKLFFHYETTRNKGVTLIITREVYVSDGFKMSHKERNKIMHILNGNIDLFKMNNIKEKFKKKFEISREDWTFFCTQKGMKGMIKKVQYHMKKIPFSEYNYAAKKDSYYQSKTSTDDLQRQIYNQASIINILEENLNRLQMFEQVCFDKDKEIAYLKKTNNGLAQRMIDYEKNGVEKNKWINMYRNKLREIEELNIEISHLKNVIEDNEKFESSRIQSDERKMYDLQNKIKKIEEKSANNSLNKFITDKFDDIYKSRISDFLTIEDCMNLDKQYKSGFKHTLCKVMDCRRYMQNFKNINDQWFHLHAQKLGLMTKDSSVKDIMYWMTHNYYRQFMLLNAITDNDTEMKLNLVDEQKLNEIMDLMDFENNDIEKCIEIFTSTTWQLIFTYQLDSDEIENELHMLLEGVKKSIKDDTFRIEDIRDNDADFEGVKNLITICKIIL